jgi:hypothetical protein
LNITASDYGLSSSLNQGDGDEIPQHKIQIPNGIENQISDNVIQKIKKIKNKRIKISNNFNWFFYSVWDLEFIIWDLLHVGLEFVFCYLEFNHRV